MAARIWPIAYGAILSQAQLDYMLDWMYSPQALRRDIAGGVSFLWITKGGERIGFFAHGPVLPDLRCELHKCYVLPTAQGQGYGSAAMEMLLQQLSTLGATMVDLRVNRHNAPAIGFYKKNGFYLLAEDCKDIGGGYVMDDFILRKNLKGPASADIS